MKMIPLTQGKLAIVDDEDFDWLNQWKWCITRSGYAIRREGGRKNGIYIYMHRAIWEKHKGVIPANFELDHKNNNKLENILSNLRLATHAENTRNKLKNSNNTSGYKGVIWSPTRYKWRAEIMNNWKKYHLGYFGTALEAAEAYNCAALKFHKEFAKLNNI